MADLKVLEIVGDLTQKHNCLQVEDMQHFKLTSEFLVVMVKIS